MDTLDVHVVWDEEAKVWYVAESNIPGLAAEAATTEDMLSKLRTLIPELVALNRHLLADHDDAELPVRLTTERLERFHFAA